MYMIDFIMLPNKPTTTTKFYGCLRFDLHKQFGSAAHELNCINSCELKGMV